MNKKAFVLLSGGMDSTTCLYKAVHDFAPSEEYARKAIDGHLSGTCDWVEAISVNYGQRHIKEAEYAAATCAALGIKHTMLQIKDILGGAMLTDKSIEIPNVTYDQIQGVSPTYVPFRNGTLLSVITAYAQKWVNEQNKNWDEQLYQRMLADGATPSNPKPEAGIYFGAHAEDAHNWAYPDCTPEFIGAMANAIFIGSYQQIRLYTPLMSLSKAEIVEMGEKLGVNWANTWSCYKGLEVHCGECPTCYARKEAFKKAGVADPTKYANDVYTSGATD